MPNLHLTQPKDPRCLPEHYRIYQFSLQKGGNTYKEKNWLEDSSSQNLR